jgi:ribonuclease HI
MQALDTVQQLIISGETVSHVVVKTDSAYLTGGLSQWIWKWTKNGFTNSKGLPVTNGKAFRYLHERFGLLEKDYGITVSFCKVDGRFNQQADRLAKEAVA